MKLTLIRHGVTEGNMKKLYYGSTDLPLLPCSVMKLHRMAEGGGYPTAPHYYTSGMLRTEQTFKALYGDIPHEVLHDMREIDFGEFEMKTYQELCNTDATRPGSPATSRRISAPAARAATRSRGARCALSRP